jgi:predicted XRE-type DNA-binding protein
VKFLLWQFAAYALAAFVLGLAMAHLWWRPRAARSSRKLNSQLAHNVALQAEIVDLHNAAQRDRNIVAAIAPLTEQLSAARSALTLVEAEREASALHQTMLTNKTVELSERAARHESLAVDTERAQAEALRTRIALDSAIAEHTAARAMSEQALADALARAQSAESSLANLRKTHERLVVDSRRELTELTMRVEQAERARLAPPATGVTAATVWQAAMVEATSSPTDDQILIVLPNETEPLRSGSVPVTSVPLTSEATGVHQDTSAQRDRPGTTLVEAAQTSPNLVIELRSSE